MPKCFVSGGSGFIGRKLVERLFSDGYEVKFLTREMFASFYELKAFLEYENPDYIFHLAAYGNHSHQDDDDTTFYVNTVNTWTLLQASKNVKYRQMIIFGTSSEYGNKIKPMSEIDLLRPNTIYAATKAANTVIAQAFAQKYKKRITVIRPFSVYGIGEAEFRFVPTVRRCIRYGEQFNLDPYQNHDWIYIDDFIDGVMCVMDSDIDIINIGTGKQFSNLEIVETMESVAGKNARYVLTPKMRINDSPSWVADNKLLLSLGWKQKHSLREGLTKCYEEPVI